MKQLKVKGERLKVKKPSHLQPDEGVYGSN
jgi:hypothetical protein